MDSALLSRFDLIFIVLDKPDEQRDHLISEHVMMLHEDPVRATSATQRAALSSQQHSSSSSNSYLAMNKQESLIERLKVSPREQFEPIHPIMLRKYISYARRHINPK
jgi:DNA helicase MCM8